MELPVSSCPVEKRFELIQEIESLEKTLTDLLCEIRLHAKEIEQLTGRR